MFFVFMKIPGKVASVASDGVVSACEYMVPEKYVNPAQDMKLYKELQEESWNGFETFEEAKAWAEEAMKRVFRFVHSTPKVRKTYRKAYVKIVRAEARTEEFQHAVDNGWRKEEEFGTGWGDTVGGSYPEWQKPVKEEDRHFTLDMSSFVESMLDLEEIEAEKKRHAEEGRKPNLGKEMRKWEAAVPGEKAKSWMRDYEYASYEKDGEKGSVDLVPRFADRQVVQELRLPERVLLMHRVGPWIEVECLKVQDDRREWWCHYGNDLEFGEVTEGGQEGGGKRRWLVGKFDKAAAEIELGGPIYDISEQEPWGGLIGKSYVEVPEMYRHLVRLGAVKECEKYRKG